MARPPKGKPLTMRTVRLDDDVWAECQRLSKERGTINEGLRARLVGVTMMRVSEIAALIPPCDEPCEHLSCDMQRSPSKPKARTFKGKRELGPKGDNQR